MMNDVRMLIASVKDANRLEEIVQRYGVELKVASRGIRYEGLCPFHAEHSPSFNVYVESQRFTCYGCGVMGDVIDFVQQFDQVSLIEALSRLGGDVARTQERPPLPHVPIPKRPTLASGSGVEWSDPVVGHAAILSLAQGIYHQTILRTPFALDYLLSRGISHIGVSLCGLGYADGFSFRMHLRGKEPLWQAAMDAGLLTRTGKEWLSGRLIIPELVSGRSTWLIGRRLANTPHWTFRAQDKYLGLALPKPLLGYGAALARLQAADHPRSLQGILVMEGALDYVVAREWDVPALPIAILGTHSSSHQIQTLFHLQDLSGGLPFLHWSDNDERGGAASIHFFDQVRGRPAASFPTIVGVKDFAELAEHNDGYMHFLHAWHRVGEGGELW